MNDINLTFYDTSRLYYASYYLKGFDELVKSDGLRVRIAQSLPEQLKSAVQDSEWQHLLFAMVLCRFQQGSKILYFCIDTHDDNAIDVNTRTGGYHLPLLESVDAYFKVNLNSAILSQTPALLTHRDKIHSIAQFFPIQPPFRLQLGLRLALPSSWVGYKPGLGHNQPYDGHVQAARYRRSDLKKFLPLEHILTFRDTPKDIDIFYVTSYRNHPRHATVMEQRFQVMDKLASIPRFHSVIGFASNHTLPARYAHLAQRRLNQVTYLETLARCKVFVYTQGMESCLSSKFGLTMALGIAAVGEPLANNPDMQAAYPHLHEQFGYTDPDTLIQQAIQLADDTERNQRLGRLNASLFDHYLSPRAAATSILNLLQSQ